MLTKAERMILEDALETAVESEKKVISLKRVNLILIISNAVTILVFAAAMVRV